ncbi:MAG: hypothetical protein QF426_02700 [Verrucomicrobiales bacterium]|nr:hypothetical protein [Verrucomicrobiales bacterium]
MKKKSELMNALKELTEKRLLTSEVEALFEPYQDAVFPLVLSFVSSERSFGSQKDEKYNEGYKVLCNAENWGIGVALLFEPEDNNLVESFGPSQEFEANVRFIDYDSLYQRAIFGKLDSELEPPEEEEIVPPSIAESDSSVIEETASIQPEERIVPEKEISVPDSEVPELKTEETQKSADMSGEVWGWDPSNEEVQKVTNAQEVTDTEPAEPDPVVPTPVQSTPVGRHVYKEAESYLYEDDYETDEAEQGVSQSTGCSKGCMQKIATTCYVVGGLIMLAGCGETVSGGFMFFGLILLGIGYVTQQATPKA